MNELYEILKFILPAGIVFLTTYYLVKNFMENDLKKKALDLNLSNQNLITPLRLQAYERVILFLERINPNSMVMRLSKTGNSSNFHAELLKTIRNEFEHNLSQQIYMSTKAWENIVKAKEETIKLINISATQINGEASAIEFAQTVIAVSSKLSELPTKPAIDFIKKEISKEF